jgi:hypothetical protein
MCEIPTVCDKSIQKLTPQNTPKLSHSSDLHPSQVPCVEASTVKGGLNFQLKNTPPYSPVSPAFRSFPAIPACTLPPVVSEQNSGRQERKVSIGNLVEASMNLMKTESRTLSLNERVSYQSPFILPHIYETEKILDCSCSVTSDSSGSFKLAQASPYWNNELHDVTQYASSYLAKNEICSFSRRSFGEPEATSLASYDYYSKKDVSRSPTKVCSNCSTTVSPNWYLAEDKRPLCNACGKFWKRTGTHRPSCHWGRKIKKRACSGGTRSKKARQHENLKERLNMAVNHQITTWENAGMEGMSEKNAGLPETSRSVCSPSQNKRTAGQKIYYSNNTEILSEVTKNEISAVPTTDKLKVECQVYQDTSLKESLKSAALVGKDSNTNIGSIMAVDSDVGSTTSFSTRESGSKSLLKGKHSKMSSLSSTSRKSQLFALDETFAKTFQSGDSSNSNSLIEILAFAASQALETAD